MTECNNKESPKGDSLDSIEREIEPKTSVCETVLETVATMDNTPIKDLPPISEQVAIEAVEKLFAPRMDGTPRDGGWVSFTYNGYRVTVEDDTVDVRLEK